MRKLAIGFITYNNLTAKYLPYFLKTLEKQVFKDYSIFVIDNSEKENNENKIYIKSNYKDIDFEWSGKNIGFTRGYNKLIEKAKQHGAKYFMVINPDTILEKDTILKLINGLEKDDKLGSVCPKILSWNFTDNKKTDIIDSYGLVMPKALRFVDLWQGDKDRGETVNQDIIGPSGACGLYKMTALKKIKDEYGYFDSRMFMYKEDCDLAYRLFINDFKSKCITDSIIYHDRTASKQKGFFENRKAKSKSIKRWSFINQQIIFKKYWGKQSLIDKFSIVYYQIKIFSYIFLFERYLLADSFKTKK